MKLATALAEGAGAARAAVLEGSKAPIVIGEYVKADPSMYVYVLCQNEST